MIAKVSFFVQTFLVKISTKHDAVRIWDAKNHHRFYLCLQIIGRHFKIYHNFNVGKCIRNTFVLRHFHYILCGSSSWRNYLAVNCSYSPCNFRNDARNQIAPKSWCYLLNAHFSSRLRNNLYTWRCFEIKYFRKCFA